MRRRYIPGQCDDCGQVRRITWITFWLNGHKMRVCANCIRPYRDRILCPERVAIHRECLGVGRRCA